MVLEQNLEEQLIYVDLEEELNPFKVSIYPSPCKYAAILTMVKILFNANSVLQNLNSFNVMISVLMHQGGHPALTKCLFVEFGIANAKRGTARFVGG